VVLTLTLFPSNNYNRFTMTDKPVTSEYNASIQMNEDVEASKEVLPMFSERQFVLDD
jgi:hypothetical protein